MMPLNWMEALHSSYVQAEKEIQMIRYHRNELLLTTAECEGQWFPHIQRWLILGRNQSRNKFTSGVDTAIDAHSPYQKF